MLDEPIAPLDASVVVGLVAYLPRTKHQTRGSGASMSVAHKAAPSAVARQLHVVRGMAGVRWVSWRYVVAVTHLRKTHLRRSLASASGAWTVASGRREAVS